MSATSVKYFSSTMSGAPVLSGTVGALIAVLDACLVTGLGLKTVDTLVVASGVATMNISTGHSAVEGGVVNVSGASPAGLNGDKRVTSVTTNTIVFDATGVSNQTATGTITMKIAPAGWTKEFGTSPVAVYKGGAGGTGFRLRVDDSATYHARVVGYESMTDVNSGTGPFPTEAQRAGGGYWPKSDTASTGARPWMLVADELGFYLNVGHFPSWAGAGPTLYFGDIASRSAADPYACGLFAMSVVGNSNYGSSYEQALGYSQTSYVSAFYLSRSYTGIGAGINTRVTYDQVLETYNTIHCSGSTQSNYCPYPNPVDGALLLAPFRVFENGTLAERGTFPGAYAVPQAVPDGVFVPGDSVSSVPGLPGRILRATKSANSSGSAGVLFLDTTGPWR